MKFGDKKLQTSLHCMGVKHILNHLATDHECGHMDEQTDGQTERMAFSNSVE